MTTAPRLCDLRRTATRVRARNLSGTAALLLLAVALGPRLVKPDVIHRLSHTLEQYPQVTLFGPCQMQS